MSNVQLRKACRVMDSEAGMSVSLSLNTRDFRSKNPEALIPVPVLSMVAEVGKNASFQQSAIFPYILYRNGGSDLRISPAKAAGLYQNSKILLAKNLYYY